MHIPTDIIPVELNIHTFDGVCAKYIIISIYCHAPSEVHVMFNCGAEV